ncbi:hypothetical protein BRADI_2g08400v3 [Brachypodium distachyon]|uniref:Uncharacterized protein n=2 Tax=Brachypodium distachyon TaxID=15368 RepID=A0A0Q3MGE8_BRADI|nr:hypothetical protein BRADI_2g08400v3 [Brachypodium distachyon]
MHSVLTPNHISDRPIDTPNSHIRSPSPDSPTSPTHRLIPFLSSNLTAAAAPQASKNPMQQQPKAAAPQLTAAAMAAADVRRAVEEKPVVVVGRRGCCMAHVARRLLLGQGANPAVLEVGDDVVADPAALLVPLRPPGAAKDAAAAAATFFPAVFIGGRLVGGLDRLMAMHIAGELVPVLKQAGALWL